MLNKDTLLHDISFTDAKPTAMHIDLNSCFASIEQQANPLLRNKPIAVAAYNTPNGCILAPSVDAKKYGIKTGMRVKDAKELYPKLIILESDPPKYRYIHKQLSSLLSQYTQYIEPKSIDEFVLDLKGSVFFRGQYLNRSTLSIGNEIKTRIKKEIGDYLTVSIGVASNRFLAKTASNLHKPDGLEEINKSNYLLIYKNLKLTDLCGIDKRNEIRLNSVGVYSVLDMYKTNPNILCRAFESKVGYYWYLRLRGFEIDDSIWDTKSIGHSYSLPIKVKTISEISPILQKLIEKIARRLRKAGYIAHGVNLTIHYRNGLVWHKGERSSNSLFEAGDIFKKTMHIMSKSPTSTHNTNRTDYIRTIYITTYGLSSNNCMQLELFNDLRKKVVLTRALDKIATKYGEFTVTHANMVGSKQLVPDRIAFGKLKELF